MTAAQIAKRRIKKEERRKRRRWNKIYATLSVVVLITSLVLSVVRFAPVFPRTLQAVWDFLVSVAYYATEIAEEPGLVTPTVQFVPDNAIEVLPFDPFEFKEKLGLFWETLLSPEYAEEFFDVFLDVTLNVLLISMQVGLLVFLYLIVVLLLGKEGLINNNHNKDTRAFAIYKKIEDKTWFKVKGFFKGFRQFLKRKGKYLTLFYWIWAYNLNVITIGFEFFAFLFYFVFSTDVMNIFVQVAKLAMDMTVAVDFLPTWAWVLIGWGVFDYARKKIGYSRLKLKEKWNRSFLKQFLGGLFIVGKQRSGKTSAITDMALTQSQIYRDDGLENLLRRSKQFPHFPWINVQLLYRRGMKRGRINMLYRFRRFIGFLKYCFYGELNGTLSEQELRGARRKLKTYGYTWDNFIFDYDYKRYGLKHNDGLTRIDVFDAIEGYVQHFFVYFAKTSLIMANYPIREDLKWTDYGNMPTYDGNFYDRDPEELDKISTYAHVMKWDAMRLGTLVNPSDEYKDAVEIGIWVKQEFSKERGNQNTNVGIHKDAKECNVKNDLYEDNTKIKTHDATVDGYTYGRDLTDDQRSDALSKDNLDLFTVMKVTKRSDPKIVMPFYGVEQLLFKLADKLYNNKYVKAARARSDNTLRCYLMKKVYDLLFKHNEKIVNTFSVTTLKLQIYDGESKEMLAERGKYYLTMKKTYSGRYKTDSMKAFYGMKASRSSKGWNDIPTYGGLTMTNEEMVMQASHMINRYRKTFSREVEMPEEKPEAKPKTTKKAA